MDDLDPIAKYRNRPRFEIRCTGSQLEPHRSFVVAIYSRDSDGTWLPIHSGVRDDGADLILPGSGYLPETGKFELRCKRRGCKYEFRHPVGKVVAVLDELLAGGEHTAALSDLDARLGRPRHTG